MKIKKMNWFVRFITLGWASAITLSPFGIYIKKEENLNNLRMINHEKIHWKQQVEMLIILFYIWYLLEWFCKTGIFGKTAYKNISFERESYINDDNLEYLKTRKHYLWLKYIINKKD
jgi:NADH:ubiquinone oxidoreductase subunit 5 (subunit L)/multisubunit Na+/H+ antiporter MnhA subunit